MGFKSQLSIKSGLDINKTSCVVLCAVFKVIKLFRTGAGTPKKCKCSEGYVSTLFLDAGHCPLARGLVRLVTTKTEDIR